MFWNLLAIENTKNLKHRLLRVELILLALLVMSILFFLYASVHGTPDGVTISDEDFAKIPHLVTWPGALVFALHFVVGTKLLLIAFVGAVTAQEYTWRTFPLWLSRGTPRPLLLAAKFTALLIPIFAFIVVALLSGAVVSAILSMQIHGTLHLDQVNFWQLGLSAIRTAYSLLPYVALTFLLAIATRSAVAAIGGSLAYGLIIESVLVQSLALQTASVGQLAKFLPTMLADSLLALNQIIPGLEEGEQPLLADPVTATLGIAVWTISLFALALWIFRRQDFTG